MNNRIAFNTVTIVTTIYTVAIAGAEATGVFIGVVPGGLCHALLILTLLNHFALLDQAPYRRILPALSLAPFLRFLGLTIPTQQVPQVYWYTMVGAPMLIALTLTVRRLNLSRLSLGLRVKSWRPQVFIALSGLPLSIAAFLIIHPEPLIARLDWRNIAIGSFILVIFDGFVEELIFRGVLQRVANETLGIAGMLFSSILFAMMHMGSLSLSYVLFSGLVGFFFSWCVNRTGSIWGVVVAHGILDIGLLIIWPFMWR